MERPRCPKCNMELPEALLAAHVAMCDDDTPEENFVEPTTPVGRIRDFIKGHLVGNDEVDDFLNLDDLGTANEREGTGGVADVSVDDEFSRLVGMLDLSDIGPMIPDVVVTILDDAELSKRYNETRDELIKRGEMIKCTTQTGRDLHSQRAAYIIELRKRGLMK